MKTIIKYKYESVADEINKMINAGEFPNGMLPSEQEFIKRFNVGRITVYNALKKLVEDEVVIRIKRKGTFINKSEFLPASKSLGTQCIPLIMPDSGHFYGDLYSEINKELLNAGFISASFNYNSTYKIEQNIRLIQLLKSGIKGIIINGDSYCTHRIMDDFPKVKSVFFNFCDSHDKPFHGAVFIDYEEGIYNITKSLLANGKKNIVLLRNEWSLKRKAEDSHLRNHASFKMDSGFKRAMLEAGNKKHSIIEIPVKKTNNISLSKEIIKDLLSSAQRPDAIVCGYDAIAVRIVIQAMLMKIDIPNELAVTGFYDTLWSLESPLPLSSAFIDKKKIARTAVKMLISGEFPSKPINILPRLIERSTT